MKRVRLAISLVSLALLAQFSACQRSGGPLNVEKVEPAEGTTGGGDEVVISGSGFEPGKTQAEVKFGHRKAESVVIASNNKLKVISPSNEKGPVDIYVSFDNSPDTFKIPNAFRYVEPADTGSVRRAFLSGGQGSNGPAKIEIEKK